MLSRRGNGTVLGRAPLTRDRVLRGAIEVADAEGIAALTMRRLGQHLGVEAMTLYHHVGKKDDLLDAIVDIATGEIMLPTEDADWKPALRATAISAYETYLRHPWAAPLSLSGTQVGPARLRYMNGILGTFRRAGFSAALTDHGYHALESHIVGFTLWEVGMSLPADGDLERLAVQFLEDLPEGEFPHLVEHVHQHLLPKEPGDEGEFAFGLDLILEGLERLRHAGRA